MVGASTGSNKYVSSLYKALSTIKGNLTDAQLFHTYRDYKFDNQIMAVVKRKFGVQYSLSAKGCLPWPMQFLKASKSNLYTK